jgi:hypothetical protein
MMPGALCLHFRKQQARIAKHRIDLKQIDKRHIKDGLAVEAVKSPGGVIGVTDVKADIRDKNTIRKGVKKLVESRPHAYLFSSRWRIVAGCKRLAYKNYHPS